MRDKIIDMLLELKVPCHLAGFDDAVIAIEYLAKHGNQTSVFNAYNFISCNTGRAASDIERGIRYAFSKISEGNSIYEKYFKDTNKKSLKLIFSISERICEVWNKQ